MITRLRHLLVVLLALAFTGAVPLHAADASSLDSLRFFGRWDRRAADRAITVNTGSYILARFSGSSISARFDVTLNKPPLPVITWRIDDGAWQYAEIAPELKLADGLTAGPHTLWLMVRGFDEHESRWKAPLVASATFLGLDLSPGGQILPALPEWDHPKLTIEFLGDSITEGVQVGGPHGNDPTPGAWVTNALDSWVAKTAMALGAMWRQVGFGATGIDHGGSGGAIAAQNSFDLFYDGCPRDNWQPDLVVINQGTNNGFADSAKYLLTYEKYLATIRTAYPKAKIVALRPFGGFQGDAIKIAVDNARAAGDKQIYYIDTAAWYLGGLHPNAAADTKIAEKLTDALKTQVLSAAP